MSILPKFIALTVSTLFLLSCQSSLSNRRKTASMKEKTFLTEEESATSSSPRLLVKYMYVVITTDEPMIVSKPVKDPAPSSYKTSDPQGNPFVDLPPEVKPTFIEPRYEKYAVSQPFTYTSDIIEISDYSEDKRYIVEDNFERSIRRNLDDANRRIELENTTTMGDYVSAEATITSVKSRVFNSYKEVSQQLAKVRHIER